MSLPADLKRESGLLVRQAWHWLRQHWRGFTCLQGLLLVIIWAGIHPHDHEWLAAVRRGTFGQDASRVEGLAGWLSKWGDLPGFNLALGLALWLMGLACHRRHWQRLALMTLLAAALSGLSAVVLRSALGRTRPQAVAADGFYGPRRGFGPLHRGPEDHPTNFQSCPSGHTTTAFTAGLSLAIAAPEIGIPTTLIAASVGWSRMFLKRHYPADVAMGIWMALWFAVPFGCAARAGNKTGSIKY